MYYIYAVILIFLSILLIFFVLIQRSKGGGIAANFAGNNQALSDRRATETVEKYTWGLLIAILVISIIANLHLSSLKKSGDNENSQESVIQQSGNIQQNENSDIDLGIQNTTTDSI